MQRRNQLSIHLQQRLSTRAHNEPLPADISRPLLRNRIRQFLGSRELPSTITIRAKEIRVAEFTNSLRTILLSPAPQIASAEPAKHRRAPSIHALALQRVKNLFDRVRHS
jgi:hypothetical protein